MVDMAIDTSALVLLSPLPSPRDLAMILEAAEGIWGAWQQMFPEVDVYYSHDSLKQFVLWGLSQESPVQVAMALLCVATSLQHLCLRIGELSLSLSLPPQRPHESLLRPCRPPVHCRQ